MSHMPNNTNESVTKHISKLLPSPVTTFMFSCSAWWGCTTQEGWRLVSSVQWSSLNYYILASTQDPPWAGCRAACYRVRSSGHFYSFSNLNDWRHESNTVCCMKLWTSPTRQRPTIAGFWHRLLRVLTIYKSHYWGGIHFHIQSNALLLKISKTNKHIQDIIIIAHALASEELYWRVILLTCLHLQ